MRFIPITIFAVASRLITLATAKPVPNWKSSGMAIPLTKNSPLLNSNKSIDLRDAISSHGRSVEEKILSGLDNYEMNTGTVHPFAVKRNKSELGERGTSVPLSNPQNNLWMGEISIGTPPKTLKVYIDTGSADMWVLQTGCRGIPADRDLWDPRSSKSAQYEYLPFRLQYADGLTVRGGRYTDNVTIAEFTADPQTFGSVRWYTSRYNYHADGLLGLAYPSVSRYGANPLLSSLVVQKRLINPTISLKLSSSGAEMYVGGKNSMLYNGDITYTRLTDHGLWQVSIDDVRVNGKKVFENIPAIFDTGASHIFGDWNQVLELYGNLGGTLDERKGFGFYSLPCDPFPTVSLTFSGKTFEISPEDLRVLQPSASAEGPTRCFITIVAQRSSSPFWIIGLPFLQGVYSVFDYGGAQVGFADLA